ASSATARTRHPRTASGPCSGSAAPWSAETASALRAPARSRSRPARRARPASTVGAFLEPVPYSYRFSGFHVHLFHVARERGIADLYRMRAGGNIKRAQRRADAAALAVHQDFAPRQHRELEAGRLRRRRRLVARPLGLLFQPRHQLLVE